MITLINAYGQTLGLSPEAIRTITAQAAHETAGFTSDVFVNANNMFGMREHKRKIIGKLKDLYHGYTTYSNTESSVNDLVDLCRRRRIVYALEDIVKYSALLKEKGYYEDTAENYTAALIKWYKQLFPESANKYPNA